MQAMVDTRVITHGGKNVFSVPLYQNLVQDRTVLNRNPSSYSIRYNMDECARLFKDIMMAKGFDADVIAARLQSAMAIEAKRNDEAEEEAQERAFKEEKDINKVRAIVGREYLTRYLSTREGRIEQVARRLSNHVTCSKKHSTPLIQPQLNEEPRLI